MSKKSKKTQTGISDLKTPEEVIAIRRRAFPKTHGLDFGQSGWSLRMSNGASVKQNGRSGNYFYILLTVFWPIQRCRFPLHLCWE